MTVDSRVAGSIAGDDTIVALATAPGRGAISIVRVSGPRAGEIGTRLVRPWPLEPRHATVCQIVDPSQGHVLDQVLVTSFVKPQSFTGEDLLEVSAHGGHYVPALLLRAIVASGARPALPGEFTRRAVLNGKLDITQAEAIGDLVDARSEAMHRAALKQLDGGLSRRIALLRDQVIGVESLIAYDIDFPEEDDGPIARERVDESTSALLDSLDALLSTVPYGELIREGAVVVIAGRPNVGKSSLFNALLGQSRAIVTDIPGTTRDAIEAFLESNGWPLRLVDTAGLREATDPVEKLGVEVSTRYLDAADVILACGDSQAALEAVVETLGDGIRGEVIKVRTKADLGRGRHDENLAENPAQVWVSAETGEGLGALLGKIDEVLSRSVGAVVADMPVLTRVRQIQGIAEAKSEISAFRDAWRQEELPASVVAVHLRAGATALESLIGAVSTEDVLDRVFSSFCVGK